jgi:hypothetical protein
MLKNNGSELPVFRRQQYVWLLGVLPWTDKPALEFDQLSEFAYCGQCHTVIA